MNIFIEIINTMLLLLITIIAIPASKKMVKDILNSIRE